MESVKELINEINTTRTQVSASTKDEIRVMKAMLNDPTFKVDVYGKSGVEGSYCPYEESRMMITNILKDTAKITTKEAMELSNQYEFGKQESAIMVGLSKEFVNTYIETGRKLPLGGREKSNISIAKKVKEEKVGSTLRKVVVNSDGTDKYENITDNSPTPEHVSLRVFSSCPPWLKTK